MDGLIVEDGKFKVYKDGTILRLNKHGVFEPGVLVKTFVGRAQSKRHEFYITYSENGKQKSYHAKRLIAEAYLPRNEKDLYLGYIDENFNNLSVDNLYWMTEEDRNLKVAQTRLDRAVDCEVCLQKTIATTGICKSCRAELNDLDKFLRKLAVQEKRMLAFTERYKSVDTENLTVTEKAVYDARLTGESFRSIGKRIGLTGSRVEQIMSGIEKRFK